MTGVVTVVVLGVLAAFLAMLAIGTLDGGDRLGVVLLLLSAGLVLLSADSGHLRGRVWIPPGRRATAALAGGAAILSLSAVLASALPRTTPAPTPTAVAQLEVADTPALIFAPPAVPESMPPQGATVNVADQPAPAAMLTPAPEHTLARGQFGADVGADDARIQQFARLLDVLEARCAEDRTRLADLATGTNRVMAGRGIREPLAETLVQVTEAIRPGDDQDCADVFVGHSLARTGGDAPSAAAARPPAAGQRPPAVPGPKPAAKPAGPAPETRAYLDWLGPKVQVIGESLRGLAAQSEQAGQDPPMIANHDWRMKTTLAVTVLEATGKELQWYSGTVPPEARRLDRLVRDLGRDLVYIAAEYTAGVDEVDQARLSNAATRMHGVGAKGEEATAEIQALRGR